MKISYTNGTNIEIKCISIKIQATEPEVDTYEKEHEPITVEVEHALKSLK